MVKVVLYAGISVDGFLATLGGDSSWVDDAELFERAAKTYGCIVLGRTTFEQFERELYPIECVQHLVLSSRAHESKYPNVHFVQSVKDAIDRAEQEGFRTVMLVGGGKTNGQFANAGMIHELILDIHPLALGQGLPLLGHQTTMFKLKLVASQEIGALIQNRYEVIL